MTSFFYESILYMCVVSAFARHASEIQMRESRNGEGRRRGEVDT